MTDAVRYHHGLAAEDIVAQAYLSQGAQILAKRARTAAGEIDLIAQQGDEILFIEVKARKTHEAASASLSVRQQTRIFQSAEVWLSENNHPPLTPCRFDLATVDAQGTVEITPNAFGL